MKKRIVIVLITIFVISGLYFALRFNPDNHSIVMIDTNTQGVKSEPSADSIMSADSTLDKITDLVADLKIVKDQIKLIDSISNKQRHISLILRPSGCIYKRMNNGCCRSAEFINTAVMVRSGFLIRNPTIKSVSVL